MELVESIGADHAGELTRLQREHDRWAGDLAELQAGTGHWANQPVGRATMSLRAAEEDLDRARRRLDEARLGWWGRRQATRAHADAEERLRLARREWRQAVEPHRNWLEAEIAGLDTRIDNLTRAQLQRQQNLTEHPELLGRLDHLNRAIAERLELERRLQLERNLRLAHDHRLEREPDLGLGI